MKENAALSRILFFLSAMVVRGGCRADDLQPALLVGRTRLDGPALEGLARLEVVAQRNAEFSAVPLLGDIHPADESFAACADVLRAVTALPQSPLELAESLEQLRWLENGYKIGVGISEVETIGIDTPEDLEKAERFLQLKIKNEE